MSGDVSLRCWIGFDRCLKFDNYVNEIDHRVHAASCARLPVREACH